MFNKLERIVGLIILLAVIIGIIFSVYQEDKPEEKQGIYKIYFTYDIIKYNSVGSDWVFKYQSNGKEIKSGDIIDRDMLIDITAIERDDIDDIATKQIYIYKQDNFEKKVYIYVTENAGRYKGNTAEIEITITVKEF